MRLTGLEGAFDGRVPDGHGDVRAAPLLTPAEGALERDAVAAPQAVLSRLVGQDRLPINLEAMNPVDGCHARTMRVPV